VLHRAEFHYDAVLMMTICWSGAPPRHVLYRRSARAGTLADCGGTVKTHVGLKQADWVLDPGSHAMGHEVKLLTSPAAAAMLRRSRLHPGRARSGAQDLGRSCEYAPYGGSKMVGACVTCEAVQNDRRFRGRRLETVGRRLYLAHGRRRPGCYRSPTSDGG
jgi:hypothetical protein